MGEELYIYCFLSSPWWLHWIVSVLWRRWISLLYFSWNSCEKYQSNGGTKVAVTSRLIWWSWDSIFPSCHFIVVHPSVFPKSCECCDILANAIRFLSGRVVLCVPIWAFILGLATTSSGHDCRVSVMLLTMESQGFDSIRSASGFHVTLVDTLRMIGTLCFAYSAASIISIYGFHVTIFNAFFRQSCGWGNLIVLVLVRSSSHSFFSWSVLNFGVEVRRRHTLCGKGVPSVSTKDCVWHFDYWIFG